MGCGRSRHRSPSLHPDGSYKEQDQEKKDGKRAAKKQKLHNEKTEKPEKTAVKAVIKREGEGASHSPKKNGRGGDGDGRDSAAFKTDTGKGGGGASGREGVAKRQWQLEEAVDSPPETVMAVYKSSVPSSARASLLGSAPPLYNPSLSSNGSLVNGGSHRPSSLSHDMELQNEIQDKAGRGNTSISSNAKPVHITNSQVEFFKMLDERIEGGADYGTDSSDD